MSIIIAEAEEVGLNLLKDIILIVTLYQALEKLRETSDVNLNNSSSSSL